MMPCFKLCPFPPSASQPRTRQLESILTMAPLKNNHKDPRYPRLSRQAAPKKLIRAYGSKITDLLNWGEEWGLDRQEPVPPSFIQNTTSLEITLDLGICPSDSDLDTNKRTAEPLDAPSRLATQEVSDEDESLEHPVRDQEAPIPVVTAVELPRDFSPTGSFSMHPGGETEGTGIDSSTTRGGPACCPRWGHSFTAYNYSVPMLRPVATWRSSVNSATGTLTPDTDDEYIEDGVAPHRREVTSSTSDHVESAGQESMRAVPFIDLKRYRRPSRHSRDGIVPRKDHPRIQIKTEPVELDTLGGASATEASRRDISHTTAVKLKLEESGAMVHESVSTRSPASQAVSRYYSPAIPAQREGVRRRHEEVNFESTSPRLCRV
ncbi:hypothetical protein L227DRAFT_654318 [Lentinus tigrinus ALCF2SS1-6]|uniref:Uncharacterized protein n=1 Tax=Lentinus tigrinus ALCF2SS1-6 TaxID=1328759 RepID=A0A5C2S594_9APHY|nr:hypothetical protein L227DRAFT_654318 [Lentinus tigrinus ALCF2SS1-6]